MEIPHTWAKGSGEGQFPNGKAVSVSVWGWGEDESAATRGGANRLERVLDRIRRGEPFPEGYGYASRPLREEILETFGSESGNDPSAIVTRNSYGARVLNAARLLFLDIDFRAPTFAEQIKRLFGGPTIEHKLLSTLRDALRSYG